MCLVLSTGVHRGRRAEVEREHGGEERLPGVSEETQQGPGPRHGLGKGGHEGRRRGEDAPLRLLRQGPGLKPSTLTPLFFPPLFFFFHEFYFF